MAGTGQESTPSRWLLIAILLGALWLRLHALTVQDIWWDEARNIDVALRPILQVANAPELDIHPPVYFWLLHAWGRVAGVSLELEPAQIAYLTRFLSVASGVAGVALVYALALAVAGSYAVPAYAGLLAAAIGAFSPFWLAESQETRMYTLGFALLMAAAVCFMQSLEVVDDPVDDSTKQPRRWPSLAAFALLSALALATHYNSVFIVVAWYAWWGVYAVLGPRGGRLRELLAVLATGAATVILVLPVAPIAMRQIPGYANPNLTVPTVADYLWQNWQAYIGGYAFSDQMMAGMGVAWLVAVLAIFVAGLALHVAGRRERRLIDGVRTRFSFVFFWLAAGLALYYLAVLDRGAFNVRYSSFVTPALYALLAIGILSWRRLYAYLPVLGAVLVLAGFVPAVHADLTDEAYAREDIAGVTQWLREHAGPRDVVFVDQKYPFGFYYDRYAIPAYAGTASPPTRGQEPVGSEAAPARYLFVDINELDARLNEWAADAENVFWVQWYESDTDPRRAVAFLLDKAGERQGEEWFHGYSIDWWRLDPPTEFELAPDLQPADHRFGDAVRTVEASLPVEPIAAGEKAPFVLRWQRVPGGSVDRPLKARLALYGADGGRLAQVDNRILNDRHLLPQEWSAEDRPLNVYMLDVPEELDAGEYAVRLLVYDADTLEPLELIEAGNPAGLEAELGTIEVTSAE